MYDVNSASAYGLNDIAEHEGEGMDLVMQTSRRCEGLDDDMADGAVELEIGSEASSAFDVSKTCDGLLAFATLWRTTPQQLFETILNSQEMTEFSGINNPDEAIAGLHELDRRDSKAAETIDEHISEELVPFHAAYTGGVVDAGHSQLSLTASMPVPALPPAPPAAMPALQSVPPPPPADLSSGAAAVAAASAMVAGCASLGGRLAGASDVPPRSAIAEADLDQKALLGSGKGPPS